jgi:hypothetical protein
LVQFLEAVINIESDDATWDKIYIDTVDSIPPPRMLPFLGQTPYLHTTSGFPNSSEHRRYINSMLKEELGSIYIRVSDFYDAAFRENDGLEPVKKCKEGISLLPNEEDSWREWPESPKESEVLDWLSKVINVVRDIASEESFS